MARMLLRLHRAIGLVFALLLIVVSLSGSLLVMHHEIEHFLERDRREVSIEPTPSGIMLVADPSDVIRQAATLAPKGHRPLRIEPGGSATEADKLLFVGPDGTTRWSVFFDPGRGTVLWAGPDQSLFTPWLLHLHMHFRLGSCGYLLGGIVGAALVLLSVSGLFVTRKRRRILATPPVGGHHPARVATSHRHRWLGLVSIYFTLVLGSTGVWFAIRIVPGQLAGKPVKAAPEFDLSRLAPMRPQLDRLAREFPDAELFRIAIPATPQSRLVLTALHRGAPVWRKFSRAEFDPATGELLRVRRASALPWRDQLGSILAPLHFGLHGSAVTKWLYAVGGLSPALLALTGLSIARQRRRRARPAGGSSR